MVKLLIIHYYIFHRFTDWHCTVLYCIAELSIVLHGFALLCCSYPRKRGKRRERGSAQQHSIVPCLKIGHASAILGGFGELLGILASFPKPNLGGGGIFGNMAQFPGIMCLEMWDSCPRLFKHVTQVVPLYIFYIYMHCSTLPLYHITCTFHYCRLFSFISLTLFSNHHPTHHAI
jgi:hypothetical protein